MFIKVENGAAVGEPFGLDQLQLLFPNTSFALPVDPKFLESLGYANYWQTTPPDNTSTHKAIEVSPVCAADGAFHQTWELTPKSEQELQTERALAAIKAREMRNKYLAESDWTQFADSPIAVEKKAAWAAYRQALRDVPVQVGFPNSIQWPVKPE